MCVFPTKQNDICYYNIQYFVSDGLMLDDIIMNLFMNTTEKHGNKVNNFILFQNKA